MKRRFLSSICGLVLCLWACAAIAAPETTVPVPAQQTKPTLADKQDQAKSEKNTKSRPAGQNPETKPDAKPDAKTDPQPVKTTQDHSAEAAEAEDAEAEDENLEQATSLDEASLEKARQRAQQESSATTDKLRQDAEAAQAAVQDAVKRDTVWEDSQRTRQLEINALEAKGENLSKQLGGVTRPLRQSLPKMEETARRLFSLSVTHQADPLMLETLIRRANVLASGLKLQLQPLNAAKSLVAELGEELNQVKYTMPDSGTVPADEGPTQDVRTDKDSEESPVLATYESNMWEQLHRVDYRINRLNYRLERSMAPAESLLAELTAFDARMIKELPPIWQQLYMTVPSRFFDPSGWSNLGELFFRMRQNLAARLSVEIPQSIASWQSFVLRLINMLILGAVILFFVNKWIRHLPADTMGSDPTSTRRSLLVSLAWVCAGLACMAASFGNWGEVYRFLLVCASLIIMWGEIALAWDTRCIILDRRTSRSPLWPMYASSAFGIVLSYPNLPSSIYALAWLLAGLASLWLTRSKLTVTLPALETKLMLCHRIALWLSIALAAVGWARMGILLLVTVDCLLINSQLIIGVMQLINRTAEVREDEQAERSLSSGLIAACLAPVVLILLPFGMALWVAALPGGAPLLAHYLGTAVSIGSATFNAIHILLIVSAFYLTRAAIAACQKILLRIASTSTRLDKSLIPPMQTGIIYALWTLFTLFTLRALGFGLENLAVVAGGLSVGIGFGLQTIVNNFLSGLILIFSRTLHEGDIIDVGNLQGVVRKISVRATTVETFDNAVIFVPNSEFVANRLINWTRNGRSVRRDLLVGVAYGTDPALVESLLLDIALKTVLVQRRPQPLVLFLDFADSSLNFTLRYWADISTALDAASSMRKQIAAAFAENKINIAFPQLDVHVINEQSVKTAQPLELAK